ncbi:MAG: SDR family NAD(P)-dependent oxidoreductase [Polyangiales bacterium]
MAISARDEDALARHAERLADALVDTRATLSAVAGTLAHRRDHFAARAAFVARDGGELAVRLRAYARDHDAQAAPARGARGDSVYGTAARVGRVAFAFSGRAIGWGEVGARLFADSAPFAAAVRRTAAALRPHVDWDPIAAVVGGASDRAAVDVRLPVAWAVSVALAALYREAGIAPDVVIGHGAGELAAASVAGILDDADAARLIVARARMPAAPAVLTVGLSLDDARARLAAHSGRIALAAHDGPRACTLAGEIDAIAAVEAELSAAGTFCRRLPHEHVTYDPQGAYDPRDLCEVIRPRAGGTTMMSTVDGSACDGARLDARYWLRDAHATARFADAVRGALDADVTHLVELSPLPALYGVLAQIAAERDPPPRVLAALRSDDDVARGLARALAQAYVAGLAPFGLLPRDTLVPLPGQTLSPRRHWLAPRVQRVADRVPDVTLAPSPVEPGTWEGTRTIDASSPPWLRDLRVHGQRVLPPAALLACALAAARARFALPSALSDLRLDAPALVSDGPRTLGVALRDDSPEGGSLRIASRASGEATWHALARARVERAGAEGAPDFPGDLCRRDAFDARTFYALLRARGHDYGTSLRGVARVYVAAPRALGELHLPAACVPGLGAEALHPTLISAALQVVLALSEEEVTLGPSAVTRVCPLVAPSAAVTSAWVYVVRRGPRHFDLTLYDAERVPRLRLDGLRLAEHPLRAPAPRFPERVLKLRFHRAPACAPQSEGSHWLVCGAREDGAEQVSAALRALGHEVTRAAARLDSPLAWRQQLERLEAPPSGIAFLTPRLAPHAQHCDTLRALAALVAAAAKLRTPPHMAIVTTFAQGVCDLDPVIPDGGLYWGFARVLRREHGVLSARVIDCGSDAASIASCATELVSRDGEDQVALRGDRRYVGRLVRGAQALERAGSRVPWQLPTQPFALRTSTRGTLAPRPLSRRAPGPGEVEIAVTAAALGGLALPHGRGLGDGSLAVGDACAGKVVALGADVGALRVGDRVIACAAGTLATHVTVSAQHVQKVPAVLSDAQAAALPCPLLTAWHGLRGVARMTRGERLLVHAAPGGIGLAAVAVARTLGVEVLATAEGDAARARLHALGVSHVFDARTLAWGEQVHAATAGRGVDAVIGASSGAALRLGLELLAEDGHYVAVQRRDAHEDERLALDVFDKGISLSAIDLSALRARRPERFAQLLAEVWSEVAAGRLPPLPLRQVRFAEAAEALRSERPQAQIEALVLTDPESVRSVVPTPRIEGRFRGDATYLVTGGLGALGLALVTFMAARGARTFLLLGRSPPRDAVGNELAALRQGGVVIETAALDVANGTALDALLGAARARLPPIRGVFHAAGLLDDATIDALTPAQLARVLAPKVEGARNLDALTASDPLDMFVLFSSASALLGTAGQAAHAAANGYLDALAEARRRRGLPALSMQWGPFDALGLAAEDAYRAARLSERGVGSVSTDEGFQAMLAFLELDVPVVGYVLLTLSRWFDAHPDAAGQPSWEALREHAGTTAAQEH